ncbi:MAG: 4Fe-4S binding protein [Caldisericia bacterium]|nr:4Fe-4S binding protein [Caldisericia bacterium]
MIEVQSKKVGYLNNPFYYLGGITFLFLAMQLISGTLLFMNFIPSIGSAYSSLVYITNVLPFGVYLRTFHRFAAIGMLIFAILHLVRMWTTDKVTKPRNLGWVTGLLLILILVVIIFTGFLSSYAPGYKAILMKWAEYFEYGRRQYQNLLSVNIGMHLLLPATIFIVLMIHFKRIARPKIAPPISLVFFILGTTSLLTAIFPIATLPEKALPYEGFVPTFPQQMLVFGIIAVICLILAFLPLLLKREKLVAKVNQDRCAGCLYCADVCPKKAITAVKKGTRTVAFVDEAKCQGCGICEGACRSSVIQLQSEEKSLLEEVKAIWLARN